MEERKTIKLQRVDMNDYLEMPREDFSDLVLVNVRGCNGAGKSTIPLQMLEHDREAFILTVEGKDMATVFPKYNFVTMGCYRTKTGGLDRFKTTEQTKQVLEKLWSTGNNILMEGVISSTIFSTYAELFKEYLQRDDPKRRIGILNLLPPLEVCLERVKQRNGGKEVKDDQIASKWRTVERNAKKFAEAGLTSWVADNSTVQIDATLGWFFKEVMKNTGWLSKWQVRNI